MWRAYCVYASHASSVIPLAGDVCNQRVCIPNSAKSCVGLREMEEEVEEEEGDRSFEFCFPNVHIAKVGRVEGGWWGKCFSQREREREETKARDATQQSATFISTSTGHKQPTTTTAAAERSGAGTGISTLTKTLRNRRYCTCGCPQNESKNWRTHGELSCGTRDCRTEMQRCAKRKEESWMDASRLQ